MDAERFDRFARALAGTGSRRGFLAGLGVLAASLAGARATKAAAKTCPPGQVLAAGNRCLCALTGRRPVRGACPCRDDADCPAPDDPCLVAACAAGTCGAAPGNDGAACGPGLACLDGACVDIARGCAGSDGVFCSGCDGGCGCCNATAEDGVVCHPLVVCENVADCSTTATCPPGTVCAVDTLCGIGKCLPVCGLTAAAAAADAGDGPWTNG